MRYALFAYKNMCDEKIYRMYVTDILRGIAASKGATDIPRWIDVVENRVIVDTRTPEQIAADVIMGAGLTMKG